MANHVGFIHPNGEYTGQEIPPNTTSINLNNNGLTRLPVFPKNLKNTLTRLYCANNQIKVLPELPPNLERLDCKNNRIETIPDIPDSLLLCDMDNNPLRPPYSDYYNEFRQRGAMNPMNTFKEKVNAYNKVIRIRIKLRQLKLLKNASHKPVNKPVAHNRNTVKRRAVEKKVNLPENVSSVVGSFLSGVSKKSLHDQIESIEKELTEAKEHFRLVTGAPFPNAAGGAYKTRRRRS